MSEYRIVTKLDPSGVVAGAAKVRQELNRMDSDAARSTGAFEKFTLGGVTGSKALASAQTELMRKMTEAAAAAKRLAGASGDATAGNAALEKSTNNVLRAVDQEALALSKANKLLVDARLAYQAGAISAEQFAKVQQLAVSGGQRLTQSLGQQRAGFTQLGFQVQDITQTLALGISPLTVLAQQGGQTAAALSLALGSNGTAGKVATFMAGPFGSILLAAGVVLGGFAIRALSAGSALEEATDKLKKDTEATEIGRQAKERYSHSEEGVAAAIRDRIAALTESAKAEQSQAERDNILAKGQIAHEIAIRRATEALLEQAIAQRDIDRTRSAAPGQRGELGTLALASSQGQVDALDAALADSRKKTTEATDLLSRSRIGLAAEAAARAVDPVKRINHEFDEQARVAKAAAGEIKGLTTAQANQLAATLKGIEAMRKARLEAEKPGISDGASRFTSRRQAIGMAGKELQSAGLRVDGNEQFGYTSGHGNNADHNKFAIDVNVGKGVTEANVPALKSRFDALARSYQRRGYDVIWNGEKYPAFMDGPQGPAKGHDNHLHIYAAQTIVGHATHSSDFAQEERDFKAGETDAQKAARIVAQKDDFVQGIVNQSAKVGLPQTSTSQLSANIEGTLAEYKRRFDVAASPEETAKITGALTEADARATAERFREAYVYPLEALQIAMGETGIEREIHMKELAEETRLGRELTDVEKGMIENSIEQTDKLNRLDGILKSIKQPLEDYKQTIAALNQGLREGSISQTEFNARVSELNAPVAKAVGDVPGVDPMSGQSYSDTAKQQEEEARYAQELAYFESHQQQILALGISYDALIEAAHQRHVQNLNNIDMARRQLAIQSAMSIADSLVSIAEMSAGKQSAVYKVMFAASKAFAIADAIIKIQQGIANALALPFPANLAAMAQVAAAAASIVSSIQAVALNLADGGMVRGPGTSRSDSIPANLSDGEYVVNAAAVSRPGNKALLDAINSGSMTAQSRQARNDNTVSGATMGGDTISLSFGDVVVQTGGGVSGSDGQAIGRDVKQALSELVDERLARAQRPGGRLTRTRASVVG